MAQTTGGMSWENAKIEWATDAAFAYVTDISGSTNKVTTSGGEITTATAFTHGTLTPLVAYGAAGLMTIEVGVLYTEVATEAFRLAIDAYKNKTSIWLRITPNGVSGTRRFTSSIGRIMAPPVVSGEAGKPDFVLSSFKLTCSALTEAATA